MRSHLLCLARELRILPESTHLLVFGSMLDRPDEAGDLDVAWVKSDNREHWTKDDQRAMGRMLRLATYGSPLYADLDLFVDTPECLWVRDGECRGLTVAQQSRALRKALRQGEAFDTWYARVIEPRLTQEHVPTLDHLVEQAKMEREAQALERVARIRAKTALAHPPKV